MTPAPWLLIAPDFASLDSIRRSPLPFVLWPVCEKPLLAWWLDEAVRQGIPSIRIVAVDRPQLLRRYLDQRDLWSRTIEVLSQFPEDSANSSVQTMNHLPGLPPHQEPDSPAALLEYWYQLHLEALGRRSSGMVHLDQEVQPGVWFAPGVKMAPGVELTAPCWVGSLARISSGCRLGPNAFIGPGAFLDEDVEVKEAIVCADTYLGSHTSLRRMVLQGGLLIDMDRGVGIEVIDDFVASSTQSSETQPRWWERLLAGLLGPFLCLLARLWNRGQAPVRREVQLGRSRVVSLATYSAGWLGLRRAPWCKQVAAGNFRLVGVLPRTAEEWDQLPDDVRAVLQDAPVGVCTLSDLYGCHSPAQPEEWMHAIFQVASPDGAGKRLAKKSFWKVFFTRPLSEAD